MMNSYDLEIARKRSGELSKNNKSDFDENVSESNSEDDADNQSIENDHEGFNIHDFCHDTFNSDYENIDLKNFESDTKDPVRFPMSNKPPKRIQENLFKIVGHKLFRRNVALISEEMKKI